MSASQIGWTRAASVKWALRVVASAAFHSSSVSRLRSSARRLAKSFWRGSKMAGTAPQELQRASTACSASVAGRSSSRSWCSTRIAAMFARIRASGPDGARSSWP
ncbi:hypothetical protein ACFU7Y_05190 [Kitasatospora sp. NPDC057542]|uniref:hypothetical protein n=1 Tax=Kitasatospora sp. NPDC057542 TaxID=3346162 RepID=UPI003683CDBA